MEPFNSEALLDQFLDWKRKNDESDDIEWYSSDLESKTIVLLVHRIKLRIHFPSSKEDSFLVDTIQTNGDMEGKNAPWISFLNEELVNNSKLSSFSQVLSQIDQLARQSKLLATSTDEEDLEVC